MAWANSGSLGRGKSFAATKRDSVACESAFFVASPANAAQAITWHHAAEKKPQRNEQPTPLRNSIPALDAIE